MGHGGISIVPDFPHHFLILVMLHHLHTNVVLNLSATLRNKRLQVARFLAAPVISQSPLNCGN
jgi:hypothetical protein